MSRPARPLAELTAGATGRFYNERPVPVRVTSTMPGAANAVVNLMTPGEVLYVPPTPKPQSHRVEDVACHAPESGPATD